MSKTIFSEATEMLPANGSMPCVSIILTFEPKMSLKSELEYKLKLVLGRVESELLANYTEDNALSVLRKLRSLVKNLNYNTHKKSVVIFASPVIEKIFYLDIAVEEKIIVDETFEIRDLVYCKKKIHKYLVLVLSGKRTKIFLGDGNKLVRIVSNIPDHIEAYKNDIPQRVSNFSDISERKEVMLDKFLHHTDDGLSILLRSYPFPLFVMGTSRVIGHFRKLSKNNDRISGVVQGNYEETPEEELKRVLEPHIADWEKVKQEHMLQQLEIAAGAGKLVSGIKNVWREASGKRARLLVVEKNYMYPARRNGENIIPYSVETVTGKFYIKDAVDDVIEKVLAGGGDVEFAETGLLKDLEHIALIKYY